jgi:hypothetical protein
MAVSDISEMLLGIKRAWYECINVKFSKYHFPTIAPLNVVGTTCFASCCDKDSAIILTTGRLPDVNLLETGVGANDCKCSRDQQLNVASEARRSSR